MIITIMILEGRSARTAEDVMGVTYCYIGVPVTLFEFVQNARPPFRPALPCTDCKYKCAACTDTEGGTRRQTPK